MTIEPIGKAISEAMKGIESRLKWTPCCKCKEEYASMPKDGICANCRPKKEAEKVKTRLDDVQDMWGSMTDEPEGQ